MKLRSLTLMMLALAAPMLQAQAKPAGDVKALLAQLDASSKLFKSATASFRWDTYERVIRDTSTQTGSIYFERNAGSVETAALVTEPAGNGKTQQKVITFKGGVAQIFDPGVNQITEVNAGANKAKWESFLTLGFGGSGQALEKAWTITDMGAETLSDGGQQVKTEKLDLVSTDPSVKTTFTHVTIWVDPVRDVSLKQIFYAPSGDTKTSFFSNIKLNSKIDKKAYEIKRDSHTTVVKHD